MPKRGTKYELTPAIHSAIVEAVRGGAFKKHAANAQGIPALTLEMWLNYGERNGPGDEIYAAFTADFEQAVAEDALRNQSVITRAAVMKVDGDWRAAAWNLEKKHPRLYGRIAELNNIIDKQTDPKDRPTSPWKNAMPPLPPGIDSGRH